MDLPILYSFRRCPYAMRARLALAVSGTPVELREVKLSAKPAEMLVASPKGTVPVLVLPDGMVIDESLDVMRWALALNDPEHWLKRTDEALIARNDGPFKHDLDRYKYPERHGSDALFHRASGLVFLGELDTRLATNGQLCDAVPGLTDMAIMPFVRQFAAVDPAWFDEQALPHLKHWLTAHLGSPLFALVMPKFAPWKPGNPPVLFPA
ncbi:MAG: glutathione S-transferase [Novosphingobium sp. 17-62-19]|uniref:glutathione S-transferase n=1 Tax=Novosphingobium sp. 17-62-19 TaxID=1970406 RepID=UPI000BC74BCD|nr:glutathione S-transferase [Novosphingobium sp. 17-62-19]OYX96382.1 MAG: glutathione S-transferase [Novosphingobium sp. 35-62-5]OZA17067.1 MAG: glutathione S-transferase [Novosphingobium sp. 17-62-19]HQS95345.1 glutathione S-transferase [Novosphingobium sp.]